MTSFLKNLKSTILDSPNSKKMPSRRHPNEDPLKRINSWDDGSAEYMRGGDRSMDGREPMYSPPLNTSSAPPRKPSRRDAYQPDYARDQNTYHRNSPESNPDRPRRHQHTERRSPSPPPGRRESRREGDKYADDEHASRRPHFNSSNTAPAARTRDMRHGREGGNPDSYSNSRSASPREHRDDRRHHRRSPSPPRRADSARNGDHREHGRDSYHESRPHTSRRPTTAGNSRHHSPSSPPSSRHTSSKYPPRASDTRPPISRSKTTSAAAIATAAKDQVAHLSPRWQKAAQAALQAGSVAAFQLRSSPGNWKGEKGAKVATAALGAAAMDAFMKSRNDDGGKDKDRDRDRDGRGRGGYEEKGGNKKRSDVEVITDVVGGFLADQFSKRK